MGLTSYGDRESERVKNLVDLIESELVTLFDSGSFKLNLDYFRFTTTFKMIDEKKWERLFGQKVRRPEQENLHLYTDIALAAQIVTEKMLLGLIKKAKQLTGFDKLVLSGGVALNCVANEKIKKSKVFDQLWIQPACGDAGGALGAALSAHYIYEGNGRQVNDSFFSPYLGPEYSDENIEASITSRGLAFAKHSTDHMIKKCAEAICQGMVIGWFQGRMEWGPRALGNRSILANAKDEQMQKRLNIAVKKRESFRPFAPAVLIEDAAEIFEDSDENPYMLQTTQVNSKWNCSSDHKDDDLYYTVSQKRSEFPAITHIDHSARIQTVSYETNPLFYKLLKEVKTHLGQGIVINTSFNVRGEPIVCSVENAIDCFLNTDIDILVCGNYFISK
jgi:carbamoyltransferase